MKKLLGMLLLVGFVLFVRSDVYYIGQQSSIMQEQNSFHETEENEKSCMEATTQSSDDIMYFSKEGDLLYRKFSNGIELQYYSKVMITKELMQDLFEQPEGVIMIHNGKLHGQLEFAGEDIEIYITESGNYAFYAIDEDGNVEDISQLVEADKQVDSYLIFLE